MATYRKLLNKVNKSKGTGSGAKDVIQPDWFAYNAMSFLHGIYVAKKTISTEFENLEDDDYIIENCQLHDTTEIYDPQTPDCNFKSPSPSSSKVSKKRKSNDKVEVISNLILLIICFFFLNII
ncbi:uncharacterized protein LOC111034403 [Myzus persicae]|uniref:uncharacterized protein LOC111034403 n=1 Tax=Myzus persicae TaxID=13164 RepID=UPI000B930ACD|nr:uncharacterized protein LOC111034403 [Myzus persicae]